MRRNRRLLGGLGGPVGRATRSVRREEMALRVSGESCSFQASCAGVGACHRPCLQMRRGGDLVV